MNYLNNNMIDSFEKLERAINHKFENIDNLRMAFIHSSYVNEHEMEKKDDNQRLEFLGDAVLELIVSDYLYMNYGR